MEDGGQISLDWALPLKYVDDQNQGVKHFEEYEPKDDTKIMFIVHGLTGGSN